MSSWHGESCGCAWSTFYGELTKPDWDRHMAHLARCTTSKEPPETVLGIAYKSTPPNAAMRRELAEFIRSHRGSMLRIKGQALVTDSAVVRGTLTALGWIIQRPFPSRAFFAVHDALTWLERVSPKAHADQIWAEIASVVPPESLWREK